MKKQFKFATVLILSLMLVVLSVTVAFSRAHHCCGEDCQICIFIGSVSKLMRSVLTSGPILISGTILFFVSYTLKSVPIFTDKHSLVALYTELDN